MAGAADIQAMIDELAATLGQSVLIEDHDQRPVFWSTLGRVDQTRLKTILNRQVDPKAHAVLEDYQIAKATEPVHTPALPEAEMWARWCMPIRHSGHVLGYLWVLDPDETIGESELKAVVECAEAAAAHMVKSRITAESTDQLRAALLDRLVRGPDLQAVTELAKLEHLPHDALIQVEAPAHPGGWQIIDDMSVHVVGNRVRHATSGKPLPLLHLSEAKRRAQATRQALAAGALAKPPTWDALGAWRLIVDAPDFVQPADLHPAAEILADQSRSDLLVTARSVLDHGGDVGSAARDLHIHRTTLYYRLERIKELADIDLQDGLTRTHLQMALWLAAYRQASHDPAHK